MEITGGEPLLQPETAQLARALVGREYTVLVETNGTVPFEVLKSPIIRIVDIKCPGSGEAERTDWRILQHLRPGDEIKFVITDRNDFEYALNTLQRHPEIGRCLVHFSPAYNKLSPRQLAQWILQEGISVHLNLQLHKILSLK